MRLRAGAYSVLERRTIEVLSVAARESTPVPRPVAEVPMFAARFVPRVAVEPELERAIDALCYTAQEEEA